MRALNVGKLRRLIEGMSDESIVVLNGSDHSYRNVYSACATTAIADHAAESLSQDHDEELVDGEDRVKVVVIE